MSELNRPQARFISEFESFERDWGTEDLIGFVSGSFTFKRLVLMAGMKGGLQYHHLKNEMSYLVEGSLLVRVESDSGDLVEYTVAPGQAVHFPPGCVHQEEALTDCVLIEVSTPFLNDRVRVEADYGLDQSRGLPSTSIDEVVKL